MYEKFFSLDELPFDGLPDNRFYYVGNYQHQALDILTTNLSRNGSICVLSGPSGSGKTTTVRMLIRSLPKRMRIIAIDDPRLDPHMLLATILRASGVVATSFESIAELTLKLRKLLEHSIESGIITTVICDEAQGLSDEVIEQIRLVSNIEGELGKMINFLLVGQEDLIENIQKPMHKMFWGRVKAFAYLKAFKRDEVHAYVTYRLQVAGCHDPIFTNRAMNALYRGTGGLPRIINSVADRALCIAFEAQKKHVSAFMVKKAIEIVRHERSVFVVGIKTFAKEFIKTLFARVPVLLSGVALSFAVFALTYKYLPSRINDLSLQSLIRSEEMVVEQYNRAMNEMLPGRNYKSKALALFNHSINNSVFISDSIDTLIKLNGYSRSDSLKTICSDLDSVSLKCNTVSGDLDLVKMVNRVAVLKMRKDDLTPFYVVLNRFSKDESEIIVGDKLFRVKTDFIRHCYDGQFTYIGIKMKSFDRMLPKINIDLYNMAMQKLSDKLDLPFDKLKATEAKYSLSNSYSNFKSLVDDDFLRYYLIDSAVWQGANLEE